ncbi:MAG: MBL fold metallo-hydrolase, partial [Thermoprotei archaeon]
MSRVSIRVLGGGHEVGRAAIAVKVGDSSKYLLLDYGVNFNERDEPQLPLHIRPSDLAGLVVTHAHLDHVGATPLLYTTAKLPAVMTLLTKNLSEIMVKDFLKISSYYLPFVDLSLKTLMDNTIDLNYGDEVRVDRYYIKLINAGHIPGSAMAYVEVDGVKILYTGDVNTIDTRLVKKPSIEGLEADVLIIESTYGNANHPPRSLIEKEFIESIKEVIE